MFGSTDLHETNPCNLIGRGRLYLRFETKAAGTLLIHSGGSVIDSLLAVYRDVSSYEALPTSLVDCATNNVHVVVTSSFGVPNPVEIPGLNAGQRFLVVVEDRSCYSGKTSSHPWDGQIPCANTATSRLSAALSTEAFHSLPVVNFIASVLRMAHVMQRNLDSIMCAVPNHISELCWDDRESVAPLNVETRRESLSDA